MKPGILAGVAGQQPKDAKSEARIYLKIMMRKAWQAETEGMNIMANDELRIMPHAKTRRTRRKTNLGLALG